MTVTYGKDEPAKHPTIFNSADVAVITKIDLAAAVEFNAAAANCSIQAVRPGMTVLDAAAKSDGGMEQFLDLLQTRRNLARVVAASENIGAFAAPGR